MGKKPLEVIHEAAVDLYQAGVIDGMTMREYKCLCKVTVKKYTPREIKSLRLKSKISQAIFAELLNTTVSTIRQWEQGTKHPRGTSLKLLNLVDKNGIDILW